MSRWRLAVLCGVVTVNVIGGCGGDARDRTIVRVGDEPIAQATLEHWISLLAPQHVVLDPPHYAKCVAQQEALAFQSVGARELKEECAHRYQALKQEALAFLMSRTWLIGQAGEQGMRLSTQDVDRAAREAKRSAARGSTVADAKLIGEAKVASTALRQALESAEPKVTGFQIATYYRRDVKRYERPERRYVNIVEKFASKAAARRVMRRVGMGKSLATIALHEKIDRSILASEEGKRRPIFKEIFEAPPHTLIGPVRLNERYAIFEVTRVVPGALRPLADVRSAIEKRLSAEIGEQALARFTAVWTNRWTARTNCSHGYVVRGCRQFNGPPPTGGPYSLD